MPPLNANTPEPRGSLLDLPVRCPGVVAGFPGSPDPARAEASQGLADLGFLPGHEVFVLARAAFGGPLAVRVGGSTFALRREEAACIPVAWQDSTAAPPIKS